MNTKPHVFVSSTCYDLSQIRRDLSEFIAKYGFQPMLSEQPSSFPINPDATTIENCIANVRKHADLFVLIVGKRFGTPDTTGKSVTNLEYLAAHEEGVPIFVFISSEVTALLPVWKANREKKFDFPGVDSDKLFEFVEILQNQSGKWCFPFDSAQQIQDVLRHQWASLIASMLDTRRRTKGRTIPRSFAHLSAEAQRLVLEQPDFWEYLLFAQVLVDGIANLKPSRRDFDLGLSFRTGQHVHNSELFTWIRMQMSAALQIPANINRLLNGPATNVFGPPGVAGDPEAIVHVAERIIMTYEKAMEWAEDLRAAIVHERASAFVESVAQFVGQLLNDFEEFTRDTYSKLDAVRKNPPKEGEHIEMTLTLTMSVDQDAEKVMMREMQSFAAAVQRGEISLSDDE